MAKYAFIFGSKGKMKFVQLLIFLFLFFFLMSNTIIRENVKLKKRKNVEYCLIPLISRSLEIALENNYLITRHIIHYVTK